MGLHESSVLMGWKSFDIKVPPLNDCLSADRVDETGIDVEANRRDPETIEG